jgi:hypothetical protein
MGARETLADQRMLADTVAVIRMKTTERKGCPEALVAFAVVVVAMFAHSH